MRPRPEPIPDPTFEQLLEGASASASPIALSALGTPLTQVEVDRIVARHGGDLGRLNFSDCDFDGDISFDNTVSTGKRLDFSRARFSGGSVSFAGCDFSRSYVDFERAEFGRGNVSFAATTLGPGTVSFRRTRFVEGIVDFRADVGGGTLDFSESDLGLCELDLGGVDFSNTVVDFSHARFRGARVGLAGCHLATADFSACQFGTAVVDVSNAVVEEGNIGLRRAGLASATVVATGSRWRQPIELDCLHIQLDDALLSAGGILGVEGEISMDGTRVAGPLRLRATGDTSVATMDRSQLSDVVIVQPGVSLADCTFTDAAGVENLRIDGRSFRSGSRGRQRVAHDRQPYDPPRRPTHFDELLGRERSTDMSPADLSSLYRKLRGGLEAAGNDPAARDFHYAELEAQRVEAAAEPLPGDNYRPADYFLLTAYKWFAGYGQRAWRAAATYLAVVAAAVAGLDYNGFAPNPSGDRFSILETVEYALRATTLVFSSVSGSSDSLEIDERFIQLGLRVFGPVLLILTFLAVRNRVKGR